MVQDGVNYDIIAQAKVIEGSVVVNMLVSGGCKTFEDDADKKFTSYVIREFNHVQSRCGVGCVHRR